MNGDCLIDFDFNLIRNFHNLHHPIVSVPLLKAFTSGHYSVANKMKWQAMGIEKAPYAAQICKKLDIDVICDDLSAINISSDYYDIITMFEVLEHLTQPREYLLKARDILRKNGILALTTPNFNCITRKLLNINWSWIHEEHLSYFTPKTLFWLLKECKFKIVNFDIKHITLPELAKVFSVTKKTNNIYKRNQEIREMLESNIFLGRMKSYANKFLNVTRLGEVIECVCEKI